MDKQKLIAVIDEELKFNEIDINCKNDDKYLKGFYRGIAVALQWIKNYIEEVKDE